MSKEEIQHHPQKGLRDQVCKDTRNENRQDGFLPPYRISDPHYALEDERDQQRTNHCFLARRTKNMIKPMIRAMPIAAQIQAMPSNVN